MTFQPGDRVRWKTTGEAGFPLIRYGFVGATEHANGRVVVMLDGDLKASTVAVSELEQVTITNVELHLDGADLLTDPSLRQGLVNLWSAEADQAGIDVCSLSCLGTGVIDTAGNGFALAELQAGGRHYVLRASQDTADTVLVKADLPRRWEL